MIKINGEHLGKLGCQPEFLLGSLPRTIEPEDATYSCLLGNGTLPLLACPTLSAAKPTTEFVGCGDELMTGSANEQPLEVRIGRCLFERKGILGRKGRVEAVDLVGQLLAGTSPASSPFDFEGAERTCLAPVRLRPLANALPPPVTGVIAALPPGGHTG
jgi:hypothetical protein